MPYVSPAELKKRIAKTPSPADLRRESTGRQYQGLFRPENLRKAAEETQGFFGKIGTGIKNFAVENATNVKDFVTGDLKVTPSDVWSGTKKTAAGTVNLVTDVAKGFNEGVVRIGKSGLEALPFIDEEDVNRVANSKYNPWAGLSKAATGKSIQEINTFQSQGKKAKEAAEKAGATPIEAYGVGGLAIVGSILMDNPISGGGKAVIRVGREGLEQLVKETTEEGVEKYLRENVRELTEKEIKKAAPAIAAAQNPDAVASAFRTSTKRNVSLIDNAVEDISKTADNSLERTTNGMREKSIAYFRENPAEITKSPIRLREVEGRLTIEDGRHRLEAAREKGIKNIEFEDVTPNYTGEKSKLVDSFRANYADEIAAASDEAVAPVARETAPAKPDLSGTPDPATMRAAVDGDAPRIDAPEAELRGNTARTIPDDLVPLQRKIQDLAINEDDFVAEFNKALRSADATIRATAETMVRQMDDAGLTVREAYQLLEETPMKGYRTADGVTVPDGYRSAKRTITGDTVDISRLKDPAYFRKAYESTFARNAGGTDEKLYKTLTKELVPKDREPSGYLADLYKKAKGETEVARETAPVKKVKASEATFDERTARTSPEGVKAAKEETNRRVSNIEPDGTHSASKTLDGVRPIKKTPAKAAKHVANAKPPIDVPPETRIQRIQRRLQDKFNRLKVIQGQIFKNTGLPLNENADAYLQQELYVGRAAERIDRFERAIIKGNGGRKALLERMTDDGITLDEIGDYLHAKHAVERNKKVASINENLPDGGSGMTNAEAAEILAKAESKPALEKYAQEVYTKITTKRLEILEAEHLMKPDAIEAIRNSYKNYVPLKVEGKPSFGQRGSAGFNVKGKDVMRVKGSTQARFNPLVQAIVDYEDTIIKAEKNKVGRTLKRLIEQNPDDKLWTVKAQQYKPVFNDLGEVEYMMPKEFKLADNVMEVRENGQIFHITMHDQPLAEAMKNMGTERGIKFLQTANAYLRAVNTYFNPEFVITNFERDIQTALINIGGEQGGKMAASVATDIPSAMKGVWRNVRGKNGKVGKGGVDWAAEYDEMKAAGGRVGWFDSDTVEERTKALVGNIQTYSGTRTIDRFKRVVDSVGGYVESTNEAVESAVRLSAYVNAKRAGLSKEAAAQLAKNLTVNFNKKGNWGVFLNSLYLFANAGIQGSARLVTAMKHKRTRRIAVAIVATSYGISEMNRALNEEEYDKIPDYEKNTNLIFMLPQGMDIGTNKFVAGGENSRYIKIKLPYGYNIFKIFGDITYETVHGKKRPSEQLKRLLLAADDAFNPLSSGSILQMASPTLFDPFAQAYENKNFAGNPIKPDQPRYGSEVPESRLYFSTVRKATKEVAKWLNEVTGGSSTESGVIDVSPELIDHYIDFLTGGVGQFAANVFESGVSLSKGDLPEVPNMPFVRKFVGETYDNVERSLVYEILDKGEKKILNEKEKENFKKYIKQALDEGQIDKKRAAQIVDDLKAGQARLKAGELLEKIQATPKGQRDALLEGVSPAVKKELKKLIKELAKQKQQTQSKEEKAAEKTEEASPASDLPVTL